MHKALIELQERELINQSTDISVLDKLLNEGSAVYCGFDPTADSLHIGSLLPLTVLNIFKEHGVPVIAVIGGATGSIGDPSFKSTERNMMNWNTIQENCHGITKVIRDTLGDSDSVIIADNSNWMKEINMLDFLRNYGKCFTVNNMMNKESVRSRIEREDQGISFTEFSYPILQALDFEYLYSLLNCKIQIGGSDQWGNMVAGIDVIHKLHGNDAECGVITLPLLTKDDGTKFGKSESGTVWLNPSKTTPFQLYQFFLNITDNECIKLYQYFKPGVFSKDKFKKLIKENAVDTKITFAYDMTKMIHNEDSANQAMHISDVLYGNTLCDADCELDTDEITMLLNGGMKLHSTSTDIVDTLVNSGLAKSKKMAREFLENGAVKVNSKKINDTFDIWSMKNDFVLQRGKNNFVIIEVLP